MPDKRPGAPVARRCVISVSVSLQREIEILFGRLLLLFIVTPLVELWLLMLVSEQLGATTTISLVLLTGFVGASLARRQGLQTWRAIERETQQGKLPAATLVDALMIFMAGLLLITPGILTDIVGFSLLVPPIRASLRHHLREAFRIRASVQIHGFGPDMNRPDTLHSQHRDEEVIDVEYERHAEKQSED